MFPHLPLPSPTNSPQSFVAQSPSNGNSARSEKRVGIDTQGMSSTFEEIGPVTKARPAMQSALQQYSIPGGALAVAYEGRLICLRGYGCANTQSNTPVQLDSLFRMASISKTFTAIATLQLVLRESFPEHGRRPLVEVFSPFIASASPLARLS